MSAGIRSALTLLGLVLIVGGAAVWGWAALTEPFPHDEPPPVCTDTQITAGTEVSRDQVVVSVFNASKRSGLAGATRQQMAERGFEPGDIGDVPKKVDFTQIWTDDPTNPAVRLVRQQFRKVQVVEGEKLGVGVVVVVGEKFTTLRKKQVESFRARADATFCKAAGSD